MPVHLSTIALGGFALLADKLRSHSVTILILLERHVCLFDKYVATGAVTETKLIIVL